jgi:squalene-hopene/tetraprenyl-beta-curcumene cyclase
MTDVTSTAFLSSTRLHAAYERASAALLQEANTSSHWTGELSTSALSTATAVMALEMVRRQTRSDKHASFISRGVEWLARHQNSDGGWGDTDASFSNISTTMLAYATLLATAHGNASGAIVDRGRGYIEAAGGADAVRRRYGRDKTFSVPILTHCALAGLVDWREIPALPFELGCLPYQFYKLVRLPVVSYALPALIAIGQVRHILQPSRNPLVRWLRQAAVPSTLRLLAAIQPTSGGFLEAAPLTSFVLMSLAASGRSDHPVVTHGVRFLLDSVRPDGSWPIDTNLATWVTTLSVNALRPESLPVEQAEAILDWLLNQQYRAVHPYTQASPGGWAWTDLPGGVPDSDDTPGAMLAIIKLSKIVVERNPARRAAVADALCAAGQWLLDLQNRDGGWPTFCRGWGALAFDRSAADLTAHAIRALDAWRYSSGTPLPQPLGLRVHRAIDRGYAFLRRAQRVDGAWLPLWFGNQHAPHDENPVYGTSRVLAIYHDYLDRPDEAQRAIAWLAGAQNPDGGWGGAPGCPSSIEETALATEALLAFDPLSAVAQRSLCWLVERVETESFREPSPIGFYFAKLWYYERLYPLIFATSALARACSIKSSGEPSPTARQLANTPIPCGSGTV